MNAGSQEVIVSERINEGSILVFDNVSKGFGVRKKSKKANDDEYMVALKDISAKVKPGEFISLLGPSGCGKTTLLRMSAGLLKPDEGVITIGDVPVTSPRKDACMVFQNFGLLPSHRTKECRIPSRD